MSRRTPVIFTALTEHERFWLDAIRIASNDTDPAPTLALAQQVRRIFSETVDTAASKLEFTNDR